MLYETPAKNESRTFHKVKDRRGSPILGLWERNGCYYYQTQFPGEAKLRKLPLKTPSGRPCSTREEAQAAIQQVKNDKLEGKFPSANRAPRFPEVVRQYLEVLEKTGEKTEATRASEKSSLGRWERFFGDRPLSQITNGVLDAFILARKAEGVTNRSVNLDVLMLGNVLRWAKRKRWIAHCITEDWESLPYKAPRRSLKEFEDLNKLCTEALRKHEDGTPVYENGQDVADYLKLLAYSGARRNSGLAVQWEDVHFDRKQLWLRKTKRGHTNVFVDFNADLEAHLKDMESRRLTGVKFLFPSPWNPATHTTTFKKSFQAIREAAGLPDFRLHDLRHLFISQCVMAGIDYMTIAAWVGHSDGGILIGKVYGHLSSEHRQRAAAKVRLGSVSVGEPTGELLKGGLGNPQPAVLPEQAKPASLAPAVNRGSTDADALTPASKTDGVDHLFANLAGFLNVKTI